MIDKLQMRSMTTDCVGRFAWEKVTTTLCMCSPKGEQGGNPHANGKGVFTGSHSILFYLGKGSFFFFACLVLPLGCVSFFRGACVAQEPCDPVCGVLWLSLRALSLFLRRRKRRTKACNHHHHRNLSSGHHGRCSWSWPACAASPWWREDAPLALVRMALAAGME